MAVQTGAAQAKETLKCEGTQILERKLAKIDLPGKISFGDGFLIEPLSESNVPKRAARSESK